MQMSDSVENEIACLVSTRYQKQTRSINDNFNAKSIILNFDHNLLSRIYPITALLDRYKRKIKTDGAKRRLELLTL